MTFLGPRFKWKFPPTIYGVWMSYKHVWHLYGDSQICMFEVRHGNLVSGGKNPVVELGIYHYTFCGQKLSARTHLRTKFNIFCLYPLYKDKRYPIKFCPICYERVIQRLKDDGFYESQCEKERSKIRRKEIKLRDRRDGIQ